MAYLWSRGSGTSHRERRLGAPLSVARTSLALTACLAGFAGLPAASASAVGARPSAATDKMRITADWKAFFNSKTPASKKIKLVQDGSAFAGVIKSESRSPMAQGVAATVAKVTLNKAMTQAKVAYTITIQGQDALSNQTGAAVLQGGTWKVGAQSFCGLLELEGTARLVPVCRAK